MDPVSEAAIKLAAASAIGWGWQMARSLKNWHNGMSFAVFAVAAVAIYIWATPTFNLANWRLEVLGLVTMIGVARGSAAGSKDLKLAPPTNSL